MIFSYFIHNNGHNQSKSKKRRELTSHPVHIRMWMCTFTSKNNNDHTSDPKFVVVVERWSLIQVLPQLLFSFRTLRKVEQLDFQSLGNQFFRQKDLLHFGIIWRKTERKIPDLSTELVQHFLESSGVRSQMVQFSFLKDIRVVNANSLRSQKLFLFSFTIASTCFDIDCFKLKSLNFCPF